MKKYALILFAAALLVPAICQAQRRKAAKRPKKEVVAEQPAENPLVAQMLEAVQKVVFIDSMVVDKSAFYSHIPLSAECGQIVQKGGVGQYTNELGDRRLEAFCQKGDTAAHLTMSDFIGGQWTAPAALKGLGGDDANHPYLMPDGTTLYFAQKGEHSIGGYDIFVTQFDASANTFSKPENIGMPFASEANDYLYVIDEPQQLGYFVTDRRQPKGKVCIYVFIPSTSRRVYPSEAYSSGQLRSLAAISRIADTWGGGQERKKAMERLTKAKADHAAKQAKADDGGQSMTGVDKMKLEAEKRKLQLDGARKDFANATPEEKAKMKEGILKAEKDLENLLERIKKAEKEERNKQYLSNPK